MLRVVLSKPARSKPDPLVRWAPDFFAHLRRDRGLRDATLQTYRHYLASFDAYAAEQGIARLSALTPAIFDRFLVEARRRDGVRSLQRICSALRAFLRYVFREDLMEKDLSGAVDAPRVYRLAESHGRSPGTT